MSYIPYTANDDAWVKHFTTTNKSKQRNGLYLLKNHSQRGEGNIELITPTAQAVERAKASLKRSRSSVTSTSKAPKRRRTSTMKKKSIKAGKKKNSHQSSKGKRVANKSNKSKKTKKKSK